MDVEKEIRELFSLNNQASMSKLIARMENQIGESISDAQYRTVSLPCPPMGMERKLVKETAQNRETVEKTAA